MKVVGYQYSSIAPANFRLKEEQTYMLYYTGRGIDLFGYYVSTHKNLNRAIAEYRENCLERTGCNLDLNVISWCEA